MVLDGSPASNWLQGRNFWGSRGFFPLSSVQEFFLSSKSRQLCQNRTVELPSYAIGQARAIMGLSAQLDEELDFREGDIIIITGVPEPGWFEGELNGRRGIFPEGFVELLNPLRVADSTHFADDRDGFGHKRMEIVQFHIDQRNLDKIIPEEEEEDDGTYAIALYRFQAMEQRELDFDVGDRIRILKTLEDGWLEGELYGNRGIFPYRFVKFEATEKPSQEEQMLKSEHSVLHTPISYLYISPPMEQPATDPHYWDVHMEDNPPSVSHDTQEKRQSQEPYVKSNNDIMQSECDANNASLKPQLPPRPHNTPCSPPISQTTFMPRPKEQNSCTVVHEDRRKRSPVSNGSQEKWFPKKALSMTTEDLRPQTERSKNKNRKNSLPLQDLVHWVEDHRQKGKGSGGSKDKHDKRCSWSTSWPASQDSTANNVCRDGSGLDLIDLDSKLSEQLSQFEKSISNPSKSGNNKVSRHFSIMEYSSETDIIRGSPQQSKLHKSPEKKKILRPPPPRPQQRVYTSPASYSVPSRQNSYGENTSLLLSLKPSRPAPLPPPNSQRNTPSPRPVPKPETPLNENLSESFFLSSAMDVADTAEDLDDSDQPAPCPFMLLKMEDVERELEIYRNTREELCLMLEDEEQDEETRAETIENLEFCDSNIESLNLELQQLKGEAYLPF